MNITERIPLFKAGRGCELLCASVAVALLGCATVRFANLIENYPAHGWRMFPFVTDADRPGNVFIEDKNGVRAEAFSISSQLGIETNSAALQDFSLQLTNQIEADALLQFIVGGATLGVHPKLSLGKVFDVQLSLTNAFYERTTNFFTSRSRAVEELSRHISEIEPGEKCYLVLEVIKAKQIRYTFSERSIRALGGDVSLGKILSATNNLSKGINLTNGLIQTFDQPRGIFFLAKQVLPKRGAVQGPPEITLRDLSDDDLRKLKSGGAFRNISNP